MKYLALLTFLLFVLLTQSAIIECAPSDPINNRSNSPDRPPRPSPDNQLIKSNDRPENIPPRQPSGSNNNVPPEFNITSIKNDPDRGTRKVSEQLKDQNQTASATSTDTASATSTDTASATSTDTASANSTDTASLNITIQTSNPPLLQKILKKDEISLNNNKQVQAPAEKNDSEIPSQVQPKTSSNNSQQTSAQANQLKNSKNSDVPYKPKISSNSSLQSSNDTQINITISIRPEQLNKTNDSNKPNPPNQTNASTISSSAQIKEDTKTTKDDTKQPSGDKPPQQNVKSCSTDDDCKLIPSGIQGDKLSLTCKGGVCVPAS